MLLTDLVAEGSSGLSSASAKLRSKLKPSGKPKKKGAAAQAKKPRAKSGKATTEAADEEGVGLEDFVGDSDDEAAPASTGERLLASIQRLGTGVEEENNASAKLAEMRRRAALARPESEFNAGGVDEEVTIEDLLAPLQGTPGFSDVKRQLEGLARQEKLPEPASDVKRSREERAVQYESTKKDQGKWIPQVRQMRLADQVELVEDKDPDMPASTASLVGTFKPADDFERELEEITRAAGATEQDVKGAHVLPMNPRIRDEKQTQQVARLKALMLREQRASKRVNKIKSKTYRRIHRKAEVKEREALMERLEHENPELAKALKQEYEKKRAQMRLLRQRNARKKWTTTMQRFAKGDKNAQREISKQAQSAHDEQRALRRAIQGKDPDQSEESDAVDLSESDSEAGTGPRRGVAKETLDKAKKLTVREIKDLEKGGELPTTGILGMNFMREAIKRKREAARQEAQTVLQELEGLDRQLDAAGGKGQEGAASADLSDDEGTAGKAGEAAGVGEKQKKQFTEEELAAARAQVDQLLERDEGGFEGSVSGPLTVRGVAAKAAQGAGGAPAGVSQVGGSSGSRGPRGRRRAGAAAAAAAAEAAVEPNPWLDFAPSAAAETTADSQAAPAPAAVAPPLPPADPGAGAAARASAGAAGATPAAKRRRGGKKGAGGGREERADEGQAGDPAAANISEDVLAALDPDSAAAAEQRELVRTAFVEGTQLEDFDEEQDELRRKKDEAESAKEEKLAGWGHWTGAGIAPRRPKGKGKGKGKGSEKESDGAAAKRPVRVQIHEGPSEAAKYFVDKVPYPFQSPEMYDQQMHMPTGPEWNALPSHLQKIKPKLFVKVGAIVPPLQYVKHLPPEKREGAIKAWAAAKQPKRLKAKI